VVRVGAEVAMVWVVADVAVTRRAVSKAAGTVMRAEAASVVVARVEAVKMV